MHCWIYPVKELSCKEVCKTNHWEPAFMQTTWVWMSVCVSHTRTQSQPRRWMYVIWRRRKKLPTTMRLAKHTHTHTQSLRDSGISWGALGFNQLSLSPSLWFVVRLRRLNYITANPLKTDPTRVTWNSRRLERRGSRCPELQSLYTRITGGQWFPSSFSVSVH